jgi:hypothetical protein
MLHGDTLYEQFHGWEIPERNDEMEVYTLWQFNIAIENGHL